MGFCTKACNLLYSQVQWYQPTVQPPSSFLCGKKKKHHFSKDLKCAHIPGFLSFQVHGKITHSYPLQCHVIGLTNTLSSGNDMCHY